MRDVAWFSVARTPYIDFFIEELNKFFNVEVVYIMKEVPSHPWQLSLPHYSMHYIDDSLWDMYQLIRKVDGVIFAGWVNWKYLLLMQMIPSCTPCAFWTDTPVIKKRLWPKKIIRDLVIKDIFNRFDQVWSTGTPGCNALRTMGCPEHKIRSFAFFYDLSRYENITKQQKKDIAQMRAQHGAESLQTIVFLCVGRLVKRKNIADVIYALSKIQNTNCVLWISGNGPEELALKNLCVQLGIEDRVFFLGWRQPGIDMETTYLASDIFVHPAITDPYGVVVTDAMALGKPVIGSDGAGAVLDRVVSGENGFIFPSGNIEKLYNAMTYFVDNPDKIESFSKQARATACKNPVSNGVDLVRKLLDIRK